MKLPFSRAHRLAANRAGTVAVEFALLAPLMICLFICCVEVTNQVMVYLKLNAAVQAAADLVAQQKTTQTVANITDYAVAAQDTMTPLNKTKLTVAFASLVWVAGAPAMTPGPAAGGWHQEVGAGALAIPTATAIAIAGTVCKSVDNTVTALCPNGDSVIIVRAQYAYSSPFSWVIPGPFGTALLNRWTLPGGNITFIDTAITRPRFVTFVPHA